MSTLTGTPAPGQELADAVLRRIDPVYLVIMALVALVVVAAVLGGFNSVLANGRVICQDCIGLFR
jgi:hypothetical protein